LRFWLFRKVSLKIKKSGEIAANFFKLNENLFPAKMANFSKLQAQKKRLK